MYLHVSRGGAESYETMMIPMTLEYTHLDVIELDFQSTTSCADTASDLHSPANESSDWLMALAVMHDETLRKG